MELDLWLGTLEKISDSIMLPFYACFYAEGEEEEADVDAEGAEVEEGDEGENVDDDDDDKRLYCSCRKQSYGDVSPCPPHGCSWTMFDFIILDDCV